MSKGIVCQTLSHSNIEIQVRNVDGYVNATAFCLKHGKRWIDFFRNKDSKRFIEKVSIEVRIITSELVITKRGKNAETWVHPDIAIALAYWISEDVQYAVVQLLKREHREQQNPSLILDRAIDTLKQNGASDEWIKFRANVKLETKQLHKVCEEKLCEKPKFLHSNIENSHHKAVTGMTSTTHRKKTGLAKGIPTTDLLSKFELSAMELGKEKSALELSKKEDASLTNKEILELNNSGCELSQKMISLLEDAGMLNRDRYKQLSA